jgi:hypothetical protein
MEYISQAQLKQDEFVRETLNYKKNGVFIDIGCQQPITISNTYLLEKADDWTGLGIDIIDNPEDSDSTKTWAKERPNTIHVIEDALKIDYPALFKKHNIPAIIDYLSLDLEPPEITLECLLKLPFSEYKFRVITFEIDEYRPGGEERKAVSRSFLKNYGYTLVRESVDSQDDFYVNPFLV